MTIVKLDARINENGCLELPAMDRVHGLQLFPQPDPKLATVSLQYGSAHTRQWCEVRMPLLDALYLLNLLEAMSRDQGYDALRRSPAVADREP